MNGNYPVHVSEARTLDFLVYGKLTDSLNVGERARQHYDIEDTLEHELLCIDQLFDLIAIAVDDVVNLIVPVKDQDALKIA